MIRLVLILLLFATAASAQSIDLSGGGVAASVDTSPADTVRLPTSAWSPDTPVTTRDGAIRRTAYQFPSSTRTTLQLIEPVRAVLEEAGYSVTFACADAACGGFDFRFQLDLLPEPDMHVDLGNYRYLLMENADASPHTVALVASSTSSTGFLHVTEVSDTILEAPPANEVSTAPPLTDVTDPSGLIDTMLAVGHAVLPDLEFQTGAANLGAGPYTSLRTLSAWLSANPTARIILVGHTDAVGSLDANISLSERRAAAVADRLIDTFSVDPGQLQSAGAGYLSPIAPNLTEVGRAANRRVEVVLLSLQ